MLQAAIKLSLRKGSVNRAGRRRLSQPITNHEPPIILGPHHAQAPSRKRGRIDSNGLREGKEKEWGPILHDPICHVLFEDLAMSNWRLYDFDCERN
jgi:hypothetical protein